MYHKAYGIIETLAPLYTGASAGEETGNLNLIFRDQFTQTGIIPGSSIRGRFRADMRLEEKSLGEVREDLTLVEYWYGKDAKPGKLDTTTEGIVKFEYASILWLPVYCPNQPVVRVSCPALLKRYQKLTDKPAHNFEPYSYYGKTSSKTLFFNLGFLPLENKDEMLKEYMPSEISDAEGYLLLVVDDTEISMIHDMALYRQSRVALEDNQKKAKGGAFFNVEALPEGTIMTFPIALRKTFNNKPVKWEDFINDSNMNETQEFYFGGLESVGFGRTQVTLKSTQQ
ncbi:MAG: type III-B CRISPR module RAMP protein Cmr4 [Richelia sp. RM2_1_2]|nr:type III-B CRISPR module RAMP protein Cmr4 [Richelia sp. SM1_7_0]NJN11453.1 type III-B CRISPR module RAMP protein Cmr4 [Richelia sp. RM1_1_1]NJO30593.1 type III-B CRISPR module RAMP protein Cmr4 [Richelia sp. SL_2_1]NJO62950.1 type III-B CRISPR module RAMP protein Cmr4 [Richelia sp. RM2_1_2]